MARALETHYARRLDEHAAELAEHFAHSSDPADLAKAVQYGELAAQRAMAVFAYGEAARLLEQALPSRKCSTPTIPPGSATSVCSWHGRGSGRATKRRHAISPSRLPTSPQEGWRSDGPGS